MLSPHLVRVHANSLLRLAANTDMDDYEFEGVEPHNSIGFFDPHINAALRCYVYALRSPDGRIFYIGKGGGSGDGNQRVFGHFAEAAAGLRKGVPPRSDKERVILETWKQGLPVNWFILRFGIDESTADEVEAALIDTLLLSNNGKLDNIDRGLRTYRGILDAGEVAALGASLGSPGIALARIFRVLDSESCTGQHAQPV